MSEEIVTKRGPGRPPKNPVVVTNEMRPEGLESAVAVKAEAEKPCPRKGTAIIADSINLAGIPFKRQDAWSGEVEFWPGTKIPAGIWVDISDHQRLSKPNIDRHFIPATNTLAITLKK